MNKYPIYPLLEERWDPPRGAEAMEAEEGR